MFRIIIDILGVTCVITAMMTSNRSIGLVCAIIALLVIFGEMIFGSMIDYLPEVPQQEEK